MSDLVKIGVPAILASGATIWAVYASRSTELKKDERRRQQDALEKIVDGFEEGHSTMSRFIALFWSFSELAVKHSVEIANTASRAEFDRVVNDYEKAIGDLSALIGRARMAGLDAVADVLESYARLKDTAANVINFDRVPSKGEIEALRKLCDDLENTRTRLHTVTHEAFRGI